jgi:penicillin-binding protein 1A
VHNLLPSWRDRLTIWRDRATDTIRRHPRAFVAVVAAMSVVCWAAAANAVVFAHQVVSGVPDGVDVARIAKMARASTFFDAHDRPAFTIFKEQRLEIPLSAMSPHLLRAIVAVEDQRFYDHGGVDAFRVVGAAVANLKEGRRAQGGSTITQQLARQSFLTPDKTFTRKMQEVILAAIIESELSKDRILELYLNKVYFGAGLYGAEAAALGYFGKHASELTLAEAALLAGLVKSPSTWAPTVNEERALSRRALVLQAMHDSGAIDEQSFARATAEPVKLFDALRKDEPYGQYFKEQVRVDLVERFGSDLVLEGGLRVFTTIDLEMQRSAEAEVQKALAALDERRAARARRRADGRAAPVAAGGEPLQAALVSIDVATGAVRALVGGRDFGASKFNRASQARRQPGSAFKPFVYAAALEAGYTPASLIENLDEPIQTLQGDWVPEDGHSTASEMTMRAALKISSNRAAVRMLEQVGISKTVDYAARLGVGSQPSVPSLALGSGEVTLESLTSAYAVFASGGVRRVPHLIRRVENAEGQVLYRAQMEDTRVLSPQTAFLMTNMLSDVINGGTAWKARQLGFRLPAAGKTGTTNDYNDAWFVGFTPRLVTGVWVGFDQPQTILPGGYAADIAVPLWAGYMRTATSDDPEEWFKTPPGIVGMQVCRLSGRRPAGGCDHVAVVDEDDGSTEVRSMIYTEYFVRGTEPKDTCPLHVGRSLFDRIAGWFGPTPSVSPDRASGRRDPEPVPAASAETPARARSDASVENPAPEKKKRGFWSRLFGKNRDDDRKKKNPR